MDPVMEIEGTWEEIKCRVPDFAGKRLHVTVRLAEDQAGNSPGPVDQALSEIWDTVPDASWEQFAPDFGENLDHYLYGTPARK